MTDRKQVTKRVRVLVIMDATGKWEAGGSHSLNDEQARETLEELTGELGPAPWGYFWVEADVPVPVMVEGTPIEGDVAQAPAAHPQGSAP